MRTAYGLSAPQSVNSALTDSRFHDPDTGHWPPTCRLHSSVDRAKMCDDWWITWTDSTVVRMTVTAG